MNLVNGIKSALVEANCSEGERQGKGPAKNFAPMTPPLSLNASELPNATIDANAASAMMTPETADGLGSIPGARGAGLQLETLSSAAATETEAALTAADMPEHGAQQLALIDVEAPARGAGRPKGAKNKSTKQWVEYFLSVCDSPMIALGKMYSENTAALASRLHCKDIEAFKVQAAAATALLPYIHQKQPTLIDTNEGTLPLIQLTVSQTVYNEVVADNGSLKDEFAGVEILDLPTTEFEEIIEDEQN